MAIAALFGANAQEYQQISAQAAAYLAQFVAALTSGGGWYAAAETANATLAHEVLNAVNAPTQATARAISHRTIRHVRILSRRWRGFGVGRNHRKFWEFRYWVDR